MKQMKNVLAVLLGLALVLSFAGAVSAEEASKTNTVIVEMDELTSGFVVEIPETLKLSNKKGEWVSSGFLNVTMTQFLKDSGHEVEFWVDSTDYVTEIDDDGNSVNRWVVKSESGKTVKYGILRGFQYSEDDVNEFGYVVDEFGFETVDQLNPDDLINSNEDHSLGAYIICSENASESLKLWTYPYEDPKSLEPYTGTLTFEFCLWSDSGE